MDSVWQSGKLHYAFSASTLLYILKKSQLLRILSQYFPIVQLSSRFCQHQLWKRWKPWSGSPGRPTQKKLHHRCFALLPGNFKWCLASAPSKSLPQDQNWVGRPDIRCVAINWKQLCLTLNLCFRSFPKWNFLHVEPRKQIYFCLSSTSARPRSNKFVGQQY